MIWKLFIINIKLLINGFSTANGSRTRKSRSKLRTVLFGILFLYLAGVFIMLFGMMFHEICEAMYVAGLGWLYFALIAIMGFALCVITSIFTVQTLIFNARDNELLLSMPVKPSTIVVSRILTLLVYEYIFNALILIPAIFVWWNAGYATLAGGVIFVLEMLLLPLLSLAVACLIGWLLAAITSRLRNKNIVNLIFSLLFLGAYFYVYFNMQSYLAALIASGSAIADAVRQAVFPAYHFALAVTNSSLFSFLIFAACAVVPFALMCAILSRGFIKLATTKRGAAKLEYREKTLRASGALGALTRIELRRFFGNSAIIMNAGIGALFAIALGVFIIIRPGTISNLLEQVNAIFPIGLTPGVICAAALMFLSSTVTYSSAAVSLEGKTLWLVKSLPIRGGSVLCAKVLSHVLIGAVPSLFTSIVCIIAFGGAPLEILATLIAPLSMSIFVGFLGTVINLAMPKLDWTNEIQPVKQGMSVVISMFAVMLIAMAIILVYMLALAGTMDAALYLLAWSLLLLLLSLGMYAYLMRGGERKFAALQ